MTKHLSRQPIFYYLVFWKLILVSELSAMRNSKQLWHIIMIYIIPINNNITNIAYKYYIWFITVILTWVYWLTWYRNLSKHIPTPFIWSVTSKAGTHTLHIQGCKHSYTLTLQIQGCNDSSTHTFHRLMLQAQKAPIPSIDYVASSRGAHTFHR